MRKLNWKSWLQINRKRSSLLLNKENRKERKIIFKLTRRLRKSRLSLNNNSRNFTTRFLKLNSLRLNKNLNTQNLSTMKMLSCKDKKFKTLIKKKLKRRSMLTTKEWNIKNSKKNWITIKTNLSRKANLTIRICLLRILKFKDENIKKLFLVKKLQLNRTKEWNLKLLEKMKRLKNF